MFTYDLTTSIGQVRLLATDSDAENILFQDAEIDVFLSLEGGNIRKAAALALETTARQEALLLKKIESLDLKTDGPTLAKELREQAKVLRAQADEVDAGGDGLFDWAEMVVDPFSARERLFNQRLRGL